MIIATFTTSICKQLFILNRILQNESGKRNLSLLYVHETNLYNWKKRHLIVHFYIFLGQIYPHYFQKRNNITSEFYLS